MTDETETPPGDDARPLTPDDRARPTLRGEMEVASLGHAWTLADFIPAMHPVWDELFDAGNLAGRYPPDRLRLAAFHLLWANYELTADEGAAIVLGMPVADVIEAVQTAMYGVEGEPYSSARTFTQWLRYGLLALGLDPGKVAPWDVRPLVNYAVLCGRALPAELWIGSAAAKARQGESD